MVMYVLADSSILHISPVHIPVHGAALAASLLFLTLSEGRKVKAYGTVFIVSTVVYSNVLGLNMQSPLPEQFSVQQAPALYHFLSFIPKIYCIFLCLVMFR